MIANFVCYFRAVKACVEWPSGSPHTGHELCSCWQDLWFRTSYIWVRHFTATVHVFLLNAWTNILLEIRCVYPCVESGAVLGIGIAAWVVLVWLYYFVVFLPHPSLCLKKGGTVKWWVRPCGRTTELLLVHTMEGCVMQTGQRYSRDGPPMTAARYASGTWWIWRDILYICIWYQTAWWCCLCGDCGGFAHKVLNSWACQHSHSRDHGIGDNRTP